VWIPKLYNGHNRSFFTFNGELYRERRSTQGFGIYPTDRMKRGDLTETFFRRADGSFIPIMDLNAKSPFPGNQIPASRISPISQKLFQFWPAPNLGPTEFGGVNNFAGVSRAPCVLICQNNQWAISTPGSVQTAAASIALKGLGYGIDAIRADGNDAVAVYYAVRHAADHARRGDGPMFVELLTYRVSAHSSQ